MLLEVRAALIDEAVNAPALLSDLAGLEEYIAESYGSRSFFELLQNADDAGASRFAVEKSGEFLLVANDGRFFNKSDFESLCRSAQSSKSRGASIGYRGIGFKSVVGFARVVHLISGDLSSSFSRERTARVVPQASRVPLIRIPHPLEAVDRVKFSDALDRFHSQGFNTVFVFDELLADAIEREFTDFDSSSLLFLRNIQQVELRLKDETLISVSRKSREERYRQIKIVSNKLSTEWMAVEQNNVAFAFRREDHQIVRLAESDAVVHAFLPTNESTGLAVKIHGDISTDPSRTRVVLDERTLATIESMAALAVSLLDDALLGKTPFGLSGVADALVPFTDPRVAGLQRRSFRTEFFNALKSKSVGRFDDLRCKPAWINLDDYHSLALGSGLRTVPTGVDNEDGLNGFLRFLGARDAAFDDFSTGLKHSNITTTGAAEIVSHLIKLQSIKQFDRQKMKSDWRLWPRKGQLISLEEAARSALPLDTDFTDLVAEKAGGRTAMMRLLSSLIEKDAVETLLPESNIPAISNLEHLSHSQEIEINLETISEITAMGLKRWRGAEQQVLQLLLAQGWKVEDVSRQNLGYDLKGQTAGGHDNYIEVKSIEYTGQPFFLTSNEEAVARQKRDKYIIALVRTTEKFIEVGFIRDPIQKTTLTRQCRQWVWECSSYPFNPQRIPLE